MSVSMTGMDAFCEDAGSVSAAGNAHLLQTIAEPNRARIIELLGHGEHCVCDVGAALGMSPALVSHHLRVLLASGLLRERRDGRWVYYVLDLDRLAMIRAAVVKLLTPTDAATGACLRSDCGPTRESRPILGDPSHKPQVPTGSLR